MKKYDAIVIGSGQAGTPLSKKLARKGLKTVLVEKRLIGGTCVNDGCTPTKAMIASVEVAYRAQNSSNLGVSASRVSIDFNRIVERKNEIVQLFRGGAQRGLEKTKNLTIQFGNAKFTGLKTLEVIDVDGKTAVISADLIFINAGTSPSLPLINGLDKIPYLTSTTILDLKEIPKHLLVIGGGYVAMEFSQMFSRLGSKVTLLNRGQRLFSKEDPDIADCLAGILRNEGITMHTNALATAFKPSANGIRATVQINDNVSHLTYSHVLLATGRKPVTGGLGLDKTGVQTDDQGFIKVNSKLQTTQPGIYALGDINGGPAFTHISYNDHLIVYKNLFEGEDLSTDNRMVPYCMFTDPQLARVGLSEQEARNTGRPIKVATLAMTKVGRAIETGQTRGMMKAIVDEETSLIMGAAIIGDQGGEIMSVLQVAMMGKLKWQQLRNGVFAHPTYAESINNLFMTFD